MLKSSPNWMEKEGQLWSKFLFSVHVLADFTELEAASEQDH